MEFVETTTTAMSSSRDKDRDPDDIFGQVLRGEATIDMNKTPAPDKGIASFEDEEDMRLLGIKVANLLRLVRVFAAFPFVIIVAAIKPSGKYAFFRNIYWVRMMNLLIYIMPFFIIAYILAQYEVFEVQVAVIAFYIFVYCTPVAFVVFSKVDLFTSSTAIEEGTFCFKPARKVRFTEANLYQLAGFFFEWIQHVLYVLPVGVVTGQTQAKVQDYPPYLPFAFYFWTAVGATFGCCFILIFNAVLRGKAHYRFQKSKWIWYVLFNVGSPAFVTIVTVLFMGLRCDYDVTPPVLMQDTDVLCYNQSHTYMARAALIALALYIVQHTLLPSGTFKETMGDDTLEIMFVPVYLSAHYLMKAIFCGVYVFFYERNLLRVSILTAINFMLLWMNNYMRPCSISWVNVLRNTIFLHASLAGIMALNYVVWPSTDETQNMLLSTILCTIFFTTVGMFSLHVYANRSTEHSIAISFLDLEWQVSHGGTVHPRVLEPLISLSLSTESDDLDIVKRYIPQLVWLLSYPNKRVQFQSAWALANLSLLEEDARVKINDASGTKTLLEWYMDMDDLVQLECLAALANLSLSYEVVDDLVNVHKAIPFLLQIIGSNKLKHSQFSVVALANISRKEKYRCVVQQYGCVWVLIGAVLSGDYMKLKFGCVALGNLALSYNSEILEAMKSKGVIDRIIKVAGRNEADTQREIVSLLRNLACYAPMREILFKKGLIKVMEKLKSSSYQDVSKWADEVLRVMLDYVLDRQDHNKRQVLLSSKDSDVRMLRKMRPLSCQVEWSTWGSKLDSIFAAGLESKVTVSPQHIFVTTGNPATIDLGAGLPVGQLKKWGESGVVFEISEHPHRGTITAPNGRHRVTYTSVQGGGSGTDWFEFHVRKGQDMYTGTVTIIISSLRYSGGESPGTHTKASQKRRARGGAPSRGSFRDSDGGDGGEDSDNGEDRGYRSPNAAYDLERGLEPSHVEEKTFEFESPLVHEQSRHSVRGISSLSQGVFRGSIDYVAHKEQPTKQYKADKRKKDKKKKKKLRLEVN